MLNMQVIEIKKRVLGAEHIAASPAFYRTSTEAPDADPPALRTKRAETKMEEGAARLGNAWGFGCTTLGGFLDAPRPLHPLYI